MTTLTDLADLHQKGLPQGRLIVHEDVDGNVAELEYVVAFIPENLMATDQTNQTKGLVGILADLWQRASKRENIPARHENLGRGLGVDLVVRTSGQVQIQVYRPGKTPSDQELLTVLKHFPTPIDVETGSVKRFTSKHIYYIQANLLLTEADHATQTQLL
jgi:hypothetical protein